MEVSYYQFCKIIAEDLGIELNVKHKMFMSQFPIKNGKRKITSFFDAKIVDRNGDEHPYMINQTVRNEEKLLEFDYIYVIRPKGLEEIIKETGLQLKSKKCRICEGGGWHSQGTRVFYKDIYCEF